MTQDKVNLLLGGFASNFQLADSVVSEKYKIPMVQGGGASNEIFSRGFKYIFGTLAPASNYFGSTVQMMKALKDPPKTVALLYADDSFDVSTAEGTRPLLKQAGFNLVMDERYSCNTSDFSTLLSQIKAKNVDAIYSADPAKDPTAVRYSRLTYGEVLAKNLKATDITAMALAFVIKMKEQYGTLDTSEIRRLNG